MENLFENGMQVSIELPFEKIEQTDNNLNTKINSESKKENNNRKINHEESHSDDSQGEDLETELTKARNLAYYWYRACKNSEVQRDKLETEFNELRSKNLEILNELERLRTIYPLQDLLQLKLNQIEEMNKQSSQLSEDHPQSAELARDLESMIQQKETLEGFHF